MGKVGIASLKGKAILKFCILKKAKKLSKLEKGRKRLEEGSKIGWQKSGLKIVCKKGE
jgi:Ran GTPase-activating protein (RanGAP) involved in mRNA processing and transport